MSSYDALHEAKTKLFQYQQSEDESLADKTSRLYAVQLTTMEVTYFLTKKWSKKRSGKT